MSRTQNDPALGGAGPGCADQFAADHRPDTAPPFAAHRTADIFRFVEDGERLRVLPRRARIERLLALHGVVARQHAEATFLRLTSTPDFIDGTVSNDDLDTRLQAAFEALKAASADVRERHGVNDDVTRICAEGALTVQFYTRFNEIAGTLQRGSA